MAGLVPAIRVFRRVKQAFTGPNAAMTREAANCYKALR